MEQKIITEWSKDKKKIKKAHNYAVNDDEKYLFHVKDDDYFFLGFVDAEKEEGLFWCYNKEGDQQCALKCIDYFMPIPSLPNVK